MTTRLRFILLCLGCSCGPSVAPTLEVNIPQDIPVGVQLQITLKGGAAGGRALSFDFEAPDLPDLKKRKIPATLTTYARNQAVFRWLPLADDVGPHEIDFHATAGGSDTRLVTIFNIVPGTDQPPLFRQPVGEGTVLDLGREPCSEIPIVVEDTEQAEVTIDLQAPAIPNATLTSEGPHDATLTFCPTQQQVTASTIYVFTLVASAGNHVVKKTYTVVVRPAPMVTCTTAAPQLTVKQHTNITTTGNLHIFAAITDDVGVTNQRLLFTTTLPADPQHPDLNAFSPIPLKRNSGDALGGMYEGVIPNPVVSKPSGTVATIYYVVEAQDADPPQGCAHSALAPPGATYSFTVKRP